MLVRFSSRCVWMSFALLGCLAVSEVAGAQAEQGGSTSPGGPAANPNAVTPPALVKFVKVELAEAESPEFETAVMTELTIDEQGRVAEAAILDAESDASASAAMKRAVLAAVQAFVFEPARRGGTPLRVKIRYRYVVEPTESADAAGAGAPDGAGAEGEAGGEANAGEWAGAGGPAAGAPTDQAKEPAGSEKPSHVAATSETALDELEEYEATAEVEAPPREVTKRSIEKQELTRIPGTRGDAIRAIEVLPGVARSQGDPLIRGSAWNESGTFLDGIPVPFLFHFSGSSFMNSWLVSEVNLYPGNFSTRYGRLTGGVVDLKTDSPRLDGLHGMIDLNFIDSSALVEGPLGDKTGIALAARRSNLDFFFENFVPDDAYSVLAAPVYYDYQGVLSTEFGGGGRSLGAGKHRLKLMAYGSRDSIELLFSNPNEEDPGLSGGIGGSIEFHRLQATLNSKLSSTATQSLSVAFGYIDIEQRIGELVQEIDGPDLNARGEWSVELMRELRMTTGVDFSGWFASGSYLGPAPTQPEGGHDLPLSTQRMISLADDVTLLRPGAYLEFGVRPWEPLLFVPGVRLDYYRDIDAVSVDPRLTARYEVTPRTALKAGVGLYSQAPEYYMVLDKIGNPKLDPYHALQTSAGIEQKVGDNVKLGAEGFYKWLYDRPVGTDGMRPPRFVNAGEGRIFGGEFSAEVRPREGTFGYLAYTISRSERRDLDERWRLFDNDQTHILSVVASHDLGKGWEVGARFRLISGDPTTPIVGSTYDATSGVYAPIYGLTNSERNPTFQQLDVRVQKKWRVGPGSVALYLDLQNAYNAENQEGYRYSFDYREKESVSGLPILPNLGLRGEL
jgi:TonB family protein